MVVELKRVALTDELQREFQQNVADAVEQLSTQKAPPAGVLRVTGNKKLVGNEDFVLVDSSGATAEVQIVLPPPQALQREVTVKVTRASSAFGVTVKAVDIPSTQSPTVDGAATVSIPVGTTGSIRVVSDGRNFWTV